MKRVVVLTGGSTPERSVALAGAGQVTKALRSRGYDVIVVDTSLGILASDDEERLLISDVGSAPPTTEELDELAAKELGPRLVGLEELRVADVLFLVLHGRQGEGGQMQALFDLAGFVYTGSDALGSVLAMDKTTSKRLFRADDIPTADWCTWPADDDALDRIGFPLIVKPSNVGSTVGLTKVDERSGLDAAVREALAYDSEVLLEAFLSGREFTVGILGDEALGVGEIITRNGIFDYESKYTPGLAQEVFPAPIEDSLAEELRALALRVHRILKLRDFSRVDFRLDAQGNIAVLEANTLPGMTAMSLLPQSAAVMGVEFADLCDRICRLALTNRGAPEEPGGQGKVR